MAAPDDLLDPDTVLQRLPDVDLTLNAANQVVVGPPGGPSVTVGTSALRLLERFAVPCTVRDGLAGPAVGAQEWIDRSSTLMHLRRAGVLCEPDIRRHAVSTYGFDAQSVHVKMLNDRPRTQAFLDAVAAAVRPKDVVVDIGTGTGILAVGAARAGARRVHAIEVGDVADIAAGAFEHNGVADRVTLVRGWSTEVELPERADVVVAEIIGDEPLDERILEVFGDAQRRLLKPGGTLIPRRLDVFATLVEMPEEEFARHTFTEADVVRWASWYGIDLGAALSHQARIPVMHIGSAQVGRWPRLAKPAHLVSVDLQSTLTPHLDVTVEVPVTRVGSLNAVVLHFDAELTADEMLSTHPDRAGSGNSWRHAVYLNRPMQVSPSDLITLSYGRNVAGRRSGIELQR